MEFLPVVAVAILVTLPDELEPTRDSLRNEHFVFNDLIFLSGWYLFSLLIELIDTSKVRLVKCVHAVLTV